MNYSVQRKRRDDFQPIHDSFCVFCFRHFEHEQIHALSCEKQLVRRIKHFLSSEIKPRHRSDIVVFATQRERVNVDSIRRGVTRIQTPGTQMKNVCFSNTFFSQNHNLKNKMRQKTKKIFLNNQNHHYQFSKKRGKTKKFFLNIKSTKLPLINSQKMKTKSKSFSELNTKSTIKTPLINSFKIIII